MKTLNTMPRLNSQVATPAREQPQRHQRSQRKGHGLAQTLFNWLVKENELRVWQDVDSKGTLRWYAYDPVSDRSYNTDSEAEMRVWVEQRYSA